MNRRAFLQRFTTGVVAVAALASLPVGALKAVGLTDASNRYACDYLRKVYNAYSKGGRQPRVMIAGHELFEAFQGELQANERFIAYEPEHRTLSLMFKGARVIPQGRGWYAKVQS